MGEIIRFPIGGCANVIRAERFFSMAGEPVELLCLHHRGGKAVVWQSGDEGSIDEALTVWLACGARLFDCRKGGRD